MLVLCPNHAELKQSCFVERVCRWALRCPEIREAVSAQRDRIGQASSGGASAQAKPREDSSVEIGTGYGVVMGFKIHVLDQYYPVLLSSLLHMLSIVVGLSPSSSKAEIIIVIILILSRGFK